MMKIFTKEGSALFNQEVEEITNSFAEEIRTAVGAPFKALILGGGYGRGEGACVIIDGRESLYNDLDLFLITSDSMELTDKIKHIAHRYEEILGIDVDIGKPIPLKELRMLPHQLMWQDLFAGHMVLAGDKEILTANAPTWQGKTLPKGEALRLMLNRGSGLLQAIIQAHKMSQNTKHQLPDSDFIRRNFQKCTLAFGDSLLITYDNYPVPMQDKAGVLQAMSIGLEDETKQKVLILFKKAVTFKQRPGSSDLSADQPNMDTLVQTANLWIKLLLLMESVRTGKKWENAAAYASDSFIREPEQHRGRLLIRNFIKNCRRGLPSFRYPRERLYRELAELLNTVNPDQPAWTRSAEKFLDLWQIYN
jgi:hypothetical protein